MNCRVWHFLLKKKNYVIFFYLHDTLKRWNWINENDEWKISIRLVDKNLYYDRSVVVYFTSSNSLCIAFIFHSFNVCLLLPFVPLFSLKHEKNTSKFQFFFKGFCFLSAFLRCSFTSISKWFLFFSSIFLWARLFLLLVRAIWLYEKMNWNFTFALYRQVWASFSNQFEFRMLCNFAFELEILKFCSKCHVSFSYLCRPVQLGNHRSIQRFKDRVWVTTITFDKLTLKASERTIQHNRPCEFLNANFWRSSLEIQRFFL